MNAQTQHFQKLSLLKQPDTNHSENSSIEISNPSNKISKQGSNPGKGSGETDEYQLNDQNSEQKNSWSEKDLKDLFKFYEKYGPKWTLIAKQLKNKSENLAKNKFYCTIRKFTRIINHSLKHQNQKNQKQIKFDSIMRVLQIRDTLPAPIKLMNIEIRKKVLKQVWQMSLVSNMNLNRGLQVRQLMETVNKFNLDTRNFKRNKSKKHSLKIFHFLSTTFMDLESNMNPCQQSLPATPKQWQSQQQTNKSQEIKTLQSPLHEANNSYPHEKDILDDLLSQGASPFQPFY